MEAWGCPSDNGATLKDMVKRTMYHYSLQDRTIFGEI